MKSENMQNESFMPYKTDMGNTSLSPLPRLLVPLDLSNDTKIMYDLLFDRSGISKESGYIEPNGTIHLYFTLEEDRLQKKTNNNMLFNFKS